MTFLLQIFWKLYRFFEASSFLLKYAWAPTYRSTQIIRYFYSKLSLFSLLEPRCTQHIIVSIKSSSVRFMILFKYRISNTPSVILYSSPKQNTNLLSLFHSTEQIKKTLSFYCATILKRKNRLTSSINTKKKRKVVKSWSFGPIDKHKPDNPRVKKTQLEKECSNWNIVTFINILKRVMNFCHIASPFLLPYIFLFNRSIPYEYRKGLYKYSEGLEKSLF